MELEDIIIICAYCQAEKVGLEYQMIIPECLPTFYDNQTLSHGMCPPDYREQIRELQNGSRI